MCALICRGIAYLCKAGNAPSQVQKDIKRTKLNEPMPSVSRIRMVINSHILHALTYRNAQLRRSHFALLFALSFLYAPRMIPNPKDLALQAKN